MTENSEPESDDEGRASGFSTQISDLECLRGLKNLKNLINENCPNITDEQVKELQKALPNLNITRNRPNRGGQRGAKRGQNGNYSLIRYYSI